jgi:hypothetical protein
VHVLTSPGSRDALAYPASQADPHAGGLVCCP